MPQLDPVGLVPIEVILPTKCAFVIFSLAWVVAITTSAEGAPDPIEHCYLCNLNAAAKAHACILKAASKEAKRNKSQYDKIFFDCEAKLASAFAKCETKAEKKGVQCPTANDAAAVWQQVLTDARELVTVLGAPWQCCSSVVRGPAICTATCYEGVLGITQDFCVSVGGTFVTGGICNNVPVCEQ